MRSLKLTQFEVIREPFEKAILKYRDKHGQHEVELSCGSHDEVSVFREGEATYVLSWNERLCYVGLECFLGHESEGEIFLQNSQDIQECLGESGLELTPMAMAKRLSYYIDNL